MAVPQIIYGTRTQVYIQQSGTGASTVAYNYAAVVKEINMSGGEGDAEQIKTLGNNSIIKMNPMDLMEVEFTCIKTDPRLFEALAGGSDANTKWAAGSMPFIVPGAGTRKYHRVWVQASGENADDWITRMVWKDAYGVSVDRNVDAEGYIEETIRFKCTPNNFTEEWSGSYTTKPISTLANY